MMMNINDAGPMLRKCGHASGGKQRSRGRGAQKLPP
jgi:hypothetical protein